MNNNNISRTSLEKDTKDHLDTFNEKEQGDDVDRHLQVQLPESLQGLSAEEIAKIDKEATRKLDILLMPILVILYILYVQSPTHMLALTMTAIISTGKTLLRPRLPVSTKTSA